MLMMNILDHVAESAARNRSAGFYPTTTKEYFALQLFQIVNGKHTPTHYRQENRTSLIKNMLVFLALY